MTKKYIVEMPEGWKPTHCEKCIVKECQPDTSTCLPNFCPLSHAVEVKEVEPLACLADRCSYFISQIAEVGYWRIGLTHYMSNGPENTEKLFDGPTYPACEALARKFLETLEDKK